MNYVTGGNMSEIYGTLKAEGGSVYLVNPNGITVGDGAEINVGSLYLSTRDLADGTAMTESQLSKALSGSGFSSLLAEQAATAALMNLGRVVVTNKVTFDGGRIVIDTDNLYSSYTDETTNNPLSTTNMTVIATTNSDLGDVDVVLGYTDSNYDPDTGFSSASRGQDWTVTVLDLENNSSTTSTGTDYNYRWITTAEQLQAMSSDLSGNYALRKTIEFGLGTNFTPIGTYVRNDSSKAFTGKFDGLSDYGTDGEGIQIVGLTINNGSNRYTGLFGYTEDATVKHVTLSGGSVSGGNDTGSLIGRMNGGTLYDAVNYNYVSGGIRTGGLVGYNSSYSTISGTLINYGNVTGTGYSTGGLVGDNNSTISGGRDEEGYYRYQIYNAGAVKGTDYVGGLVGGNSGTLSRAFNLGKVIATGECVGGAVGYNSGSATISEVFNTGTVSGGSSVGGLVGYMYSGTLKDSYSTGEVTTDGGTAIGNAVGYLEDGSVSRVYSSQESGKLVGSISSGTIEKSYSFSSDDENEGITYLSGENRSQEESYSGWDFDDTWILYGDTPILRCFLTTLSVNLYGTGPEWVQTSLANFLENWDGSDLIGDLVQAGYISGPDMIDPVTGQRVTFLEVYNATLDGDGS